MSITIHQQTHGYRSGHQLLRASVRLDRADQDVIDRLSDMAGPLRPGERFSPYLSGYPIPSGKFYILARTEQDLDAPRAGCVTSRSLLVPIDFWEMVADPASLALILESQATGAEPVIVSGGGANAELPPVTDVGLTELVEALFLEKRSPIVMFDAPHADTIALRLLTALWPALRGGFSLCTFALSPRLLADRPFDLLFAPKSARSRFSDWEGRRIEVAGKASVPRHRWSPLIEQRIFVGPQSRLLDWGMLSVLSTTGNANENVLRLSLLWDELRRKAEESPTAVLGLIDIATSQKALDAAWPILKPEITAAASRAVRSLRPAEAWNFVTALLGKLEEMPPLFSALDIIIAEAGPLVERDASSALRFLASLTLLPEAGLNQWIDLVAERLPDVGDETLRSELVHFPPDRILLLAARNAATIHAILSAPDGEEGASLLAKLIAELRVQSDVDLAYYRRLFLSQISSSQHASLLAQLLRGADAATVAEAIGTVWVVPSARSEAIGAVLCEAAIAARGANLARDAFASIAGDLLTDQCLLRLIGTDPADIQWLLLALAIEERRAKLLATVIHHKQPAQLQELFAPVDLALRSLQILGVDPGGFATAITSLLLLPSIPSKLLLDEGQKIFHLLAPNERAPLARSLAFRVLSDEVLQGDDLPERILGLVATHSDVGFLIDTGLSTGQDGSRVSRVLIAFDRATAVLRGHIVNNIERVVGLITTRRGFDLTGEGAQALARLVDATAKSHAVHLRVCSSILPFAMGAPQKPASALIIVAFPVVYQELRQSNQGFDFLKFFNFVDWDRCKIARKTLVCSFLGSSWPPVDLARAGHSANDLDRILKILLKEAEGDAYLAKIQAEIGRLDPVDRKPIRKAIKQARRSRSSIYEWET